MTIVNYQTRVRLACFIGGLLLTGLISGCAQQIDTAEEYLELAYKHERDEQYPEAIAAYRKALELSPQSATAWYDLGVSYAALEQFSDAVDCYSRAISFDPAMAQSYNNRAAAYARLKKYSEAISDCSQAIELTPDDALAWRNRGLAYHDLGKLDEAAADYDESIRINGRSSETYLYRGNLFLERKDADRALEDFDHALHLNPEMATVWISRAKALAALGRRDEAERALAQSKTLGAVTDDVDLDEFDSSVAHRTENDVRQHAAAVAFVKDILRTRQKEVRAVDEPWDLAEAGDAVRYVVRLTKSAADSHVMFEDSELAAFRKQPNQTTTLVIVRNCEASQQTPVTHEVVAVISAWTPDLMQMLPTQWSLRVPESAAHAADSWAEPDVTLAR